MIGFFSFFVYLKRDEINQLKLMNFEIQQTRMNQQERVLLGAVSPLKGNHCLASNVKSNF